MNGVAFRDLQEALLWVFYPILAWWLALLAASGIFTAILVMWFSLLGYMSRRWR